MMESFSKEPIHYLEHLPELLKLHLSSKKHQLLSKLRETMLLCYHTRNYRRILSEICPILKPILKLYSAPKEEFAFYLEMLSKCLFSSAPEISPSDAADLAKYLVQFTKIKVKGKFTLSWESALKTLETLFSEQVRSGYHICFKDKMSLQETVPAIIKKLKKYFAPDSGKEIYKYLRSYIGKGNPAVVTKYVIYMSLLLRTDAKAENLQYWMKDLLELWEQNTTLKTFSAAVISLLAELARSHKEIDWTPYKELVIQRALAWIKQITFKAQPESSDSLEEYEKKLTGNAVVAAANLIANIVKTGTELSTGLPVVKRELQPGNSADSTSNAAKFVYSFFYSLCLRVKTERSSKKIKEEDKLKKEALLCLFNEFLDILDLQLYYPPLKNANTLNSLPLVSFLLPDRAFDHFIPKLLQLCSNPDITHEQMLQHFSGLITPLTIAETKFYDYLQGILDATIKEVTFVSSDSGKLALEIIADILCFLPIPLKDVLKKSFLEVTKKGTYEDYLAAVMKSNPSEYYYHNLVNSLEEQMCELLTRVLTYIEIRDAPGKKEANPYAEALAYFANSVFANLSQEMTEKLLDLFTEFVSKGIHTNCIAEISALLTGFVRRFPEGTAKKIIPFVLDAVLKKGQNAPSDTLLTKYMEEAMPAMSIKLKQYCINPYLSPEHIRYYCSLIYPILMNGLDTVQANYLESIELILTLLLLEKDKQKHKLAAKLFYTILWGATPFFPGQIPLEKQVRWQTAKSRLELYKSIGQFDNTLLTPEWKTPTLKTMRVAQQLIKIYGLGLGELAASSLIEDAGKALPVMKKWIHMVTKVVPACVRVLHKEGDGELNIVNTLLSTAPDLLEFFATLREKVFVILIRVINQLQTQNILETTSTKLPQKLAKCVCSVGSLLIHQDSTPKVGVREPPPAKKGKFKDPTKLSYTHKYSHYHRKALSIYHQLFHYFEERNEYPSDSLTFLINAMPDILQHTPEITWIEELQYNQVISNIKDKEFHRNLLMTTLAKIHDLVEYIASAKYVENGKKKLLGRYLKTIEVIFAKHQEMVFKEGDVLRKDLVEGFLFAGCASDMNSLEEFSFAVLELLERILEVTLKYKPVKTIVTTFQGETKQPLNSTELGSKIDYLKAELAVFKELKTKVLSELVEWLTNRALIKVGTNFKYDTMIICLLSFLAGHYDNDPKYLTAISNALSTYIVDENSITRGLALVRIIEVLALRQRIKHVPKFIYSHEYENDIIFSARDKYSKIVLDSAIKIKHGLNMDHHKVYVDKTHFGWLCPPPYIRFYDTNETLIEEVGADRLRDFVTDKDLANKLFTQSYKIHENEDTGEDEAELIPNSFWIQSLLTIFEQRYTIRTELFSPIQAGFFQSLFEYYGETALAPFINLFEDITENPNKSLIFTIMEIISGYLRATKVMKKCNSVEYCFNTALHLYKSSPPEALKDFMESFAFFTKNRDPSRWSGLALNFFETLMSVSQSHNFFECAYHILALWDWRGKSLADCFLKLMLSNNGNTPEATKASAYMAGCLGEVLFQICDCNYESSSSTECYHWEKGKKIIEILKAQQAGSVNVRQTVLYILNEAITNRPFKSHFQSWILKELTLICYECVVDEEKQVNTTALEIAANLVTAEYKCTDFEAITNVLQSLIKSPNWRLRYISTCDLLALASINWMHLSRLPILMLVSMLYDPVVEIAGAASKGLINIFILLPKEEVTKLVDNFIKSYSEAKKYGPIFGLVAMVKAYGMVLPDWLPSVLQFLARLKHLNGNVGEAVKGCLSEFLQLHKKTWECEKEKFTEEQLEDITEHVSPYDYYAQQFLCICYLWINS
eukprot:TRINITY_DN120803_c0_g1_i1.p1 TRINITY_DN120803_c0_g1~~TRINITY_DN120803_c0_g1_i1.p1  ORF type:complete len:1820 (-),score=174.58 TRINITY_DN120803_c0_g1_i1:29-5488(-)